MFGTGAVRSDEQQAVAQVEQASVEEMSVLAVETLAAGFAAHDMELSAAAATCVGTIAQTPVGLRALSHSGVTTTIARLADRAARVADSTMSGIATAQRAQSQAQIAQGALLSVALRSRAAVAELVGDEAGLNTLSVTLLLGW